MIEIRWKIENCNILAHNYDLHPNRLINLFIENFQEKKNTQLIAECGYNNRS